jgi:Holliday junction DNA helicase RuvA
MIGYLQGEIVHKEPTHFVIDVGGIGYEVKISLNTFSVLKDAKSCKIFTYLHIKEDSHTLFGFSDQSEKELFVTLIGVSGIGPSTAIMMLSSLSVREIQEAIAIEDVVTIKSIKGIGGKTAERIIVELKDKVRKEIGGEKAITTPMFIDNQFRNEALTALVTLGIPKGSAEKSINMVLKNANKDISLEELIKQALKIA